MKKENISNEISKVFDAVVNVLENTEENALNEIPFEGSWTIGQIADHIIICSGTVHDSKTQYPHRQYDEHVAEMKSIFLNMEQKSEAAPIVSPRKPPHCKQELIEKLKDNKAHLLLIIEERDLTQLSLDIEFPFIGYLTRYEWLNFIAVHTQRHLNQVNNVKKRLTANADIW